VFDSVSIDASTKSLVINTASAASGRSEIVVRATDAGGLSVDKRITVDVNRTNQPPEIHDLVFIDLGLGAWNVVGDVVDPDDYARQFIVNFSNVFNTRCATDETGHFDFVIYLTTADVGTEWIQTHDAHGAASTMCERLMQPA
jgi:hypothetical protein